jgi:hypothetical protein
MLILRDPTCIIRVGNSHLNPIAALGLQHLGRLCRCALLHKGSQTTGHWEYPGGFVLDKGEIVSVQLMGDGDAEMTAVRGQGRGRS